MTNLDRLRQRAGHEQRATATPNEVQLSIQAALAEGKVLDRLKALETTLEHAATKEYVLERIGEVKDSISEIEKNVRKQTTSIMIATITVAVSVLAVAIVLVVQVLRAT